MPIRPEMKARYPADWKAVRVRIQARAGDVCEWCRVPNHAVGYRDRCGAFVPLCGSGPCDFAGAGRVWPSGERIGYAAAREFADVANTCNGGRCDDEGRRWVVVVCTVAHVHDPDPANTADDNLAFLCQRCHNRHDGAMRAWNAADTRKKQAREAAAATPSLFTGAAS
jgi:hypothetical protein